MTPADPELLVRLEERVKALTERLDGIMRAQEAMARLIEKNDDAMDNRVETTFAALTRKIDLVVTRVVALENFRSYLKPGIALLAVLGLAMVAQLGAQMWAAATAAHRPSQSFPLKAPTNTQEAPQ